MAAFHNLVLVSALGASAALAAGTNVIESRGHLITLEEARQDRSVAAFGDTAPGQPQEKLRGALCDLSVTNETGDYVQLYLGDAFIGYAWPWGTTRGLFAPETITLSARSLPQRGSSLAWSTSPFKCEGAPVWRLAPAEASAGNPPGHQADPPCTTPMPAERFDEARQMIRRQVFRQAMLSVAQSVAATNCLLVSQVADIMSLFAFDDYKLEFARFAYDHTLDRDNYYTLSSRLAFAQNRQALADYIRSRQ